MMRSCAKKFKVFISQPLIFNKNKSSVNILLFSNVAHKPAHGMVGEEKRLRNPLVDQILQVLGSADENPKSNSNSDLALSNMGFNLSIGLVLDVLNHGRKDVLSCVKFFDWARRQPNFSHNDSNKFEQAGKLVEQLGTVPMHQVYGGWIKALVKAGRLDDARQSADGYVDDLFGYNTMLCKLLSENRLDKVLDLLSEMHDIDISPNEATMNAVLCFFCKAGMVGVVLDLYNSMKESRRLWPSSMPCNYLINILCREGRVDEAYFLLKSYTDQGYFLGNNTFKVISASLCRQGKLQKMKDLLLVATERNFISSYLVYEDFIQALCKAGRVQDGYTIHRVLNHLNKVVGRNTS